MRDEVEIIVEARADRMQPLLAVFVVETIEERHEVVDRTIEVAADRTE